MSEPRELIDRMTDAVIEGDLDALAALYAVDALAVTPELGEMKGREEIVAYFKGFIDAFSDRSYEPVAAHQTGDVAIDEGFFSGTNTGPLPDPSGDMLPATGKRIRLRTCDVAVVTNGVITTHRFYYDQMEFLDQLDLLPDMS